MKQHTPLEAVLEVDSAFNNHDLEKILSIYEDNAIMVVEPGKIALGKDEIRKAFINILKNDFSVRQIKTKVIETEDIALFLSKWALEGKTKEGQDFFREFTATTVFRKHKDGKWRAVIDNSFGIAILED